MAAESFFLLCKQREVEKLRLTGVVLWSDSPRKAALREDDGSNIFLGGKGGRIASERVKQTNETPIGPEAPGRQL
jgi:hypothetical protein